MKTLRTYALAGLLLACGALSACDTPTAHGADEPARRSYSTGVSEDTIHASALVIKFPDGNFIRFGSSTDGVIITGRTAVNNAVTSLTFTSNRDAILGANGFLHDSQNLGLFSTFPVSKQVVTGDRSAGVALTNLLNALSTYGMVTDLTVP